MTPERMFMLEAVKEGEKAMELGEGRPFGAVVTRNGEIVARGRHTALATGQPTDHAEFLAMRGACRLLGVTSLRDCELYASGQPCLMCLAAAHIMGIPVIYYANTFADTALLGQPPGDKFVASFAAILGFSPEEACRFDGIFKSSANMRVTHLPMPEALALYHRWREHFAPEQKS